jgi:coproporphyrinogen III oxidase-like Fe-S oxidoreductase
MTERDRARERVLMAMRSVKGLTGQDRKELDAVIKRKEEMKMVGMGLLVLTSDGGVKATNKGLDLLDSVMEKIVD